MPQNQTREDNSRSRSEQVKGTQRNGKSDSQDISPPPACQGMGGGAGRDFTNREFGKGTDVGTERLGRTSSARKRREWNGIGGVTTYFGEHSKTSKLVRNFFYFYAQRIFFPVLAFWAHGLCIIATFKLVNE